MSSVPSPRDRKPKSANPIEPFDDHDLETADRGDLRMGARRGQLRGMDRLASFDGQHAKHLHAPVAPGGFGDHPRALVDGLEAVAPQHRDMEQDIRFAAIGNDEAVPLGYIEPLDPPGDLHERERLSVFRDA